MLKIFRKQYPSLSFVENFLSGHIRVGPVVIFGENAMHWAVNITIGHGFLCFRLPIKCFGKWYPLYCYYSLDGTPSSDARWFWGKH